MNMEQENSNEELAESEFEIDNLPNRLTLFRIVLVPLVIVCLYLQKSTITSVQKLHTLLEILASSTFILASVTDYFDGLIARKRNLVTIFGSFLDPIADKFLTVSALIMLNYLDRLHVILLVILVLREFYMTSLRLLASSEGLSVPVDELGKWKTALQMVGIPLLMVTWSWHDISTRIVGELFILVAAVLSLYSAVTYSMGLIKKMKKLRLEKKRARLK